MATLSQSMAPAPSPSAPPGLVVLPSTPSVSSLLSSFLVLNKHETDCCYLAATIAIFIAFLLSLSSHITVMLLSSIASGLAALLTLIAFAIDIALFVYVKHKMHDLEDVEQNTITGPGMSPPSAHFTSSHNQRLKTHYINRYTTTGFWITFATFLLLLIASCTVCFGRRKERMAGATSYPEKPGVLSKLAFWRR